MFHVLMNWYKRRFSDPNAVTLFLLLLAGFAVIYFFGDLVGPILVALVLAYLLDWPTQRLMRLGCSRSWSATLVLCLFIGIMLLILIENIVMISCLKIRLLLVLNTIKK